MVLFVGARVVYRFRGRGVGNERRLLLAAAIYDRRRLALHAPPPPCYRYDEVVASSAAQAVRREDNDDDGYDDDDNGMAAVPGASDGDGPMIIICAGDDEYYYLRVCVLSLCFAGTGGSRVGVNRLATLVIFFEPHTLHTHTHLLHTLHHRTAPPTPLLATRRPIKITITSDGPRAISLAPVTSRRRC